MTTLDHRRRPAGRGAPVTVADVDVPEQPNRCTSCRKRHDDPTVGQLCLDCTRGAVTQWSGAMASTVRAMTPEYRRLLGIDDTDPRFGILE